jgi:putative transposase
MSYPSLRKKPYFGSHFWSRDYFVSTVGLEEEKIKRFVKYQEKEDKKEKERRIFYFNTPDWDCCQIR